MATDEVNPKTASCLCVLLDRVRGGWIEWHCQWNVCLKWSEPTKPVNGTRSRVIFASIQSNAFQKLPTIICLPLARERVNMKTDSESESESTIWLSTFVFNGNHIQLNRYNNCVIFFLCILASHRTHKRRAMKPTKCYLQITTFRINVNGNGVYLIDNHTAHNCHALKESKLKRVWVLADGMVRLDFSL